MEHEIIVKKQLSIFSKVLKGFIFCWPLILLITAFFFNLKALIPAFIAMVVSIILLPYFEVEYEYVFDDSRIQIEKIIGRKRRKRYICIEKTCVRDVKMVQEKRRIEKIKNFYDCSSGRLPLYQVKDIAGGEEREILLTLTLEERKRLGI